MQCCSNRSEAEIPCKQGNLQGISSFQACLAGEPAENPMSDNGLLPYSLRGQTGNFERGSREFAAPSRDNFRGKLRGKSTGTGPAKPPFTGVARRMMLLWHIIRSESYSRPLPRAFLITPFKGTSLPPLAAELQNRSRTRIGEPSGSRRATPALLFQQRSGHSPCRSVFHDSPRRRRQPRSRLRWRQLTGGCPIASI
jgi:hypothetical protein